MRRIFTLFPAVFLLLFAACEPSTGGNGPNGTPPDTLQDEPAPAPVEFASPEGIASDGQFVYVSNVGKELKPQEKDGDGYILRLSMDLKTAHDRDKFGAIRLNAPKGMAVLNKHLYVADIDRLVVIDLKKIEQVAEFDFQRFKVDFLNDVAVKDDSTLFVSATNTNQIFQVNLKQDNFEPLRTDELRGPNGLFYQSEENKLYCAEWGTGEPNGRIIAIDPPTGKIRQLNEHTGNLDGIAFLRSGAIAFSDWTSGGVLILSMVSGDLQPAGIDSIGGPADFWYDTAADQLYIPHMMESKVSIFPGSVLP